MTPIATAACAKNAFVLLMVQMLPPDMLFLTDHVGPFGVGNSTTGKLAFYCPAGQTLDVSGQFCCDNPENLKAMAKAAVCRHMPIHFKEVALAGAGPFYNYCPSTKEFGMRKLDVVKRGIERRIFYAKGTVYKNGLCCAHRIQLRHLPPTASSNKSHNVDYADWFWG